MVTFINDLESRFDESPRYVAIKEATLGELTKQPYCGNFLMY